ncbi:MAG: hypothetical protein IT271_01295 [Chitinophagales bacterium]|nr:hypothetical protein [Chitinophagales bacterium]
MVLLQFINYIRIKDWWNYILPPVLCFFYAGLLVHPVPFQLIFKYYILFLILTISIAAYGFFINEWCDMDDDLAASKNNILANTSLLTRIGILLFILSVFIFSICNVNFTNFHCLIIGFQLCLLTVYSIKPFRIKNNKVAAVITDALYSGTLFYILAFDYSLRLHQPSAQEAAIALYVCLFSWGFVRGIRNIFIHLIKDAPFDSKINLDTFGNTISFDKQKKILLFIILPIEFILLFAVLIQLPHPSYTLPVYFIFHLKKYYTFLTAKYSDNEFISKQLEWNYFYEIWLPVLFIVLLAIKQDVSYVYLLLIHLILFPHFLYRVYLSLKRIIHQ